jgi:hypothetical protein
MKKTAILLALALTLTILVSCEKPEPKWQPVTPWFNLPIPEDSMSYNGFEPIPIGFVGYYYSPEYYV